MKIQGVIPVMMLPLDEDGSIDEIGLRRQVDFAIGSGAAAICAPGFGTEVYKLTDEERRHVIRVVADHARRRVPTFAGTGCGSARATIELSQYAQSVGADGVMVSTPASVSLGAPELSAFFETVCRNVNVPVMLQDADFTGAGLPASLIVELADRCRNLKFAKLENALAGRKCSEIVRLSHGNVQVFYGTQGIALLDGLAHGATGVMPGPSFIEVYARTFELYWGERTSEAKALFYRMQPYITFAVQHLELLIQIEKRALVRRDVFSSDRMREPTIHPDDQYQQQMDELIALMLEICHQVQNA
jgi:dihydrodipicolinate synthase/N-acetylneuraminate lyase